MSIIKIGLLLTLIGVLLLIISLVYKLINHTARANKEYEKLKEQGFLNMYKPAPRPPEKAVIKNNPVKPEKAVTVELKTTESQNDSTMEVAPECINPNDNTEILDIDIPQMQVGTENEDTSEVTDEDKTTLL